MGEESPTGLEGTNPAAGVCWYFASTKCLRHTTVCRGTVDTPVRNRQHAAAPEECLSGNAHSKGLSKIKSS